MITLTRKKVVGIAIVIVVAIALAVTLPLVMSTGGLGQTTPMSIRGHLVIERNGVVVVDKDNIIVTTGYKGIAYTVGYYAGVGGADPDGGYAAGAFNVIGVGTDDLALAITNVDIAATAATEQARQTAAFHGLTNTTWQVECDWGAGDLIETDGTHISEFTAPDWPIAIVESGVFNELNPGIVGTMLCRATFGIVTILSGDSLQIWWTFDLMG